MNKALLDNILQHIRSDGWCRTLGIYRHALRWKVHRDWLHSEFLIRRVFDYKMLLCLRQEGISEVLNLYGKREAEHVYILDRVLREGMCILDLGGNIGYYTLMMAARVGPSGKVYAVEPVPDNYRVLVKNIKLNRFTDRVESFQMGISDRTELRTMTLSKQSNLHSFHDDATCDGAAMLDLSGTEIHVQTEDLGTFIEGKRPPELIRMDVEGHEVEILTSLVREVGRRNWFPDVLFECHADMYSTATHDIARPMRDLFAAGYHVRFMASSREPAPGFTQRGYRAIAVVHDPGHDRGIYENVDADDAVAIMQEPGQARCMFITHSA